jgi:hypothetical protein
MAAVTTAAAPVAAMAALAADEFESACHWKDKPSMPLEVSLYETTRR